VIHGLDTSFLVALEVASHPERSAARRTLDRILDAGDGLALAPQALAEFVHVITDGRRFERPLEMAGALRRVEAWWYAEEVVLALPNEHTTPRFMAWMRDHRLGRKRLLDTLLAATYASNEISSILTTNARDFAVFGVFDAPHTSSQAPC
jgi:predicted nucleic acid-binding protein